MQIGAELLITEPAAPQALRAPSCTLTVELGQRQQRTAHQCTLQHGRASRKHFSEDASQTEQPTDTIEHALLCTPERQEGVCVITY